MRVSTKLVSFEQLLIKNYGYRGNPKREAFEKKAKQKSRSLKNIKELISFNCCCQAGFINSLHKSKL